MTSDETNPFIQLGLTLELEEASVAQYPEQF